MTVHDRTRLIGQLPVSQFGPIRQATETTATPNVVGRHDQQRLAVCCVTLVSKAGNFLSKPLIERRSQCDSVFEFLESTLTNSYNALTLNIIAISYPPYCLQVATIHR